ncbi:MAG: hypothetical protein A4E65_02655 [Syntrophorhabdus sp. PtaU1.Bin153]|nr:MAG: hypothetical protein A4E65_02655 [Syntrophorhabdus sp. PtaU1.Bin153]
MAKIVCISKYPPIEGGVAARTFWLAKALVDGGHEVHIVTDRLGAANEYSHSEQYGTSEPANIFVHRPQGEIPWHIPNRSHSDIELLDLAIQIVRDVGADVIDTGYLVPYGIIGFLASRATGVPFILRHGGSDIQKFLKADILRGLIVEAFRKASLAISDSNSLGAIENYTERVIVLPPYVPDPSFFCPLSIPKNNHPLLALIGKANYYWRHKGWHRAVETLRQFQPDFQLLVVSQGTGLGDFKRYVMDKSNIEVQWRPFVHPLSMPSLLNKVEGIFVLTDDAPFPAFSNLLPEALSCGTTVIVDSPGIIHFYEKTGIKFGSNLSKQLLAMNQLVSDGFFTVDYLERGRRSIAVNDGSYGRYINNNENALLSACK